MFALPRTTKLTRKRPKPKPLRYPFVPKPYVPTQHEIDAAKSVLQYLPRRKTVNPKNADTYVDLKLPCERISREYISARDGARRYGAGFQDAVHAADRALGLHQCSAESRQRAAKAGGIVMGAKKEPRLL